MTTHGDHFMDATQPRLDRDEIARRGDDLYARQIRPTLRPEDHGKFVAIDVESGAYEVDENYGLALSRLHHRVPGAQGWLVRVGYPYVHKFRGVR